MPHSSLLLGELILKGGSDTRNRFIITAPRDESVRNSIDRILEQANDLRRETRLFKCRFIVYLLSLLCWVCTICDVVMTAYFTSLKQDSLMAEAHNWSIEGPVLVLVAVMACLLLTFTTQVIVREIHIHSRVYFCCLAMMVLIIAVNAGWILKEDTHGHIWRNSSIVMDGTRDRILKHFKFHGEHFMPIWLDKLQQDSKCCGLENLYDWKSFWRKPDVPDSCCIDIYDGCGRNIFTSVNTETQSTKNLYLTGCLKSPTTFNFTDLILEEQVKFVEVFLIIFVALIWLCKWEAIVRPSQQIILRCVLQPSPDSPIEAQPLTRPEPNLNHDLLPAHIPNALEIVSVESRHQKGGGDLGTSSMDSFTPKAQDNFQDGDYTEIDPINSVLIH